jgi:hypothetical protein
LRLNWPASLPALLVVMLTSVGFISAGRALAMNVNDFVDVASQHPASDTLRRLFPTPPPAIPQDFAPTRLTKKDYLKLVAGNVDFWKKHLSDDGAILDFYEKDATHPQGQERQYSTPAFALAAAELVKEAGRDDLLEPATRAFSFALTALVNKTTANEHADFYIPMLIHAHRILASRVPKDTAAKWEAQFQSLIPEKNYRDVKGGGNWNLVNVSGEAMRRKDKLVATTQMAGQQAYLDEMLKRQQKYFTKFGMYEDANYPLAYDAFPRLWMEDMTADGAYAGPERDAVERFLALGSFSSMLLMSPSGEWPCGGRSAHHQWNEAENAVIAEINAARWKARGRDDIAGSFKRIARLGLRSMFRWQRPSGELWIVKNFGEPADRLGFEGYGFNSQYNLLPMAMLCIAYERADESIDERPIPSEYSTYVFDAHEGFTTVVAASGGYYALINTNADPHYGATGLQRVHRRGVELSPLTDSAAEHRGIQAKKDDVKAGLSPGLQWKGGDGKWVGLCDFHRFEPTPKSKPKPGEKPPAEKPQRVVKGVTVSVDPIGERASFQIKYELDGPDAAMVAQRYDVSPQGVECTEHVAGEACRFALPVLIDDGARRTEIKLTENYIAVTRAGGRLTVRGVNPVMNLSLEGPHIPTHNGYVQAVVSGEIGDTATWQATLEPVPLPAK